MVRLYDQGFLQSPPNSPSEELIFKSFVLVNNINVANSMDTGLDVIENRAQTEVIYSLNIGETVSHVPLFPLGRS